MKTVKSTTTFEIWSRAYLRLKAHSQQLLPLGFFLGVLPALLSFVYLSFAGASALPASLEGVDFSKANQQLADVFQPLTFFFSMYSLVYLGVSFLWFLLYCSVLVFLAEGKKTNWKKVVQKTFFRVFPGGILFLILFFFLHFETAFFGKLRVLVMFGLMTPVLYLYEEGQKKSFWHSFKRALFLKYLPKTKGASFSLILMFITSGAFFSCFELAIDFCLNLFLHLDEYLGLPRDLWVLGFFGAPFTFMFFVSLCLETLLQVFLFVFAACVFCEIYQTVMMGQDQVSTKA